MKRAFLFLIAAPFVVALASWATLIAVGGPVDFASFLAMVLFLLTLSVTALPAIADGCLARVVPISLRAPLTAITGAMGGCALAFFWLHCFVPPSELMFFPLGGALCAGLCSLLSHDFGRREEPLTSAA